MSDKKKLEKKIEMDFLLDGYGTQNYKTRI